jgi:hypothetical protein
MRRGRALVVLVAAALVGCSSSAPGSSPRSTSPVPPSASTPTSAAVPTLTTSTLRCSDVIGTGPPASDAILVPGTAAFPNTHRTALQTGRTGETGSTRLFAKWGLYVRAGAKFVITVGDPSNAAIGWGNPAVPAQRFVVPGCAAAQGSSSGWLGFAGGYFVNKPGCTAFTVAYGDRTQTVRIGVGAPCPGERPPPAPTQT